MNDYKTLKVEQRDGYAEVILSRPQALNALNRKMALELCDVLSLIADREDVRAVLLRGDGRAFCAGGDVKEMHVAFDQGAPGEFFEEPLREIHAAALALAALPRPVVCAVHGFASGAGFNLALGADFILSATDARFNQAFVRLGLVPDCGGTFHLPRRIGLANAMELFLLGDFVDAERASQLGLVQRLFPAGELLGEARAFTARLAQGPTRAYAEIRKLVQSNASATLAEALDAERQAQLRLANTADFREGVTAMLQKRKANFTGQ